MRAFLAAVLAGACSICAQPALAANGTAPGVHIDPGSPAGKQYQIPITSARGETSGKSHASPSGAAPTFGSGVTPSTASATTQSSPTATTSSRTRHTARHRGHAGRHRTSTTHAPVTVNTQVARRSTTQANQVGSSSWLPLAAGGALVLLIGCGGGLALKRRM